MSYLVGFIGFYLSVIGTWRLATATRAKPVGDFLGPTEMEKNYRPLKDLYAIGHVIKWIFDLIKSYNSEGGFTDGVILHKQFNWGLLWLITGICIQYLAGLL